MGNNITHYGNAQALLQTDRTNVNYDDKGLVVGRAVWRGQAAYPVGIGEGHPIDGTARAYRYGLSYAHGDYIFTNVDYIGLVNDPTDYYIEYSGTTTEEPIETHPDFVTKIGGTAANRKNKAWFDPVTGEFSHFPANAPQDLGGVKGYLAPRATARVSYYSYSKPEDIASLGNIDNPPVSLPTHDDENANWLLASVSWKEYANVAYYITLEYYLSGRRGWNSLMYAP